MFSTLAARTPADPDLPPRAGRLALLRRVLDGTLYDALPYEFHDERNASGEYIPLRQRRPSVRYPLARIVVDDSLALVFSEGHFPTITASDPATQTALADIAAECGLNQVMADAAWRGSIGSVAILLRVLRTRVFFRVLDTQYLTPTFDPMEPDALISVTERYKVAGSDLAAQGYAVLDPAQTYWFQRVWDTDAETWFLPIPTSEPDAALVADEVRTVRHALGFVPVVWIRNLPGGDDIDGACTFRPAVETSIEIDYQLSQAGRGLKYSSDPLLMVREPAATDGEMVRGGGNALVVSEKGDAKLLEIGGTAASAVIEYVRTLREMALEGVHGNRASADRIAAAQSGRALELMNQGLIWLADNLRVSYGRAMLQLARMILRASELYPLTAAGAPLPPLDPGARLALAWPGWYPTSPADRATDAQTLVALTEAGLLPAEIAAALIRTLTAPN